jgi:hypothetical protein
MIGISDRNLRFWVEMVYYLVKPENHFFKEGSQHGTTSIYRGFGGSKTESSYLHFAQTEDIRLKPSMERRD